MNILDDAIEMLKKYSLCDNCLGRQFALLGHGLENSQRGEAIKMALLLQNSALTLEKNPDGAQVLKILASNGLSQKAEEALHHLKKRKLHADPKICDLCKGHFQDLDQLTEKILEKISKYDYSTFLIGVETPIYAAEKEDEFKALFNIRYGESIKHEFGRLIGKRVEVETGKRVEYGKPDIMIIVNPFSATIKLQVNPLFIEGRYRKLVRDIPQSEWFCSHCRGRGCSECGGSGLQYSDSVEAFVSKPILKATEGEKTSFHASGREDIDARMLGSGRPFVVEVSKPKKRLIDLNKLVDIINEGAREKVETSRLRFANRETVRKLKKSENAQKEYRALIEFETEVSDSEMQLVEQTLNGVLIKQQTPLRVKHRRADLVRERYIYKLKVKKLSPKEALMEIRCQGGLYVKELVSGDEGRTVPSVAEILNKPSKIIKLDVLKVIIEDH